MSALRVLRPLALIGLVAGALTSTAPALGQGGGEGRIGADRSLLNSGRSLSPFGRLVGLGQLPTGGAVTPDGRFYWTVSAGRGLNDVRIVSVAQGKVVQTLRLPGASGGIVMDPVRSLVYVSGVGDSDASHGMQRTPPGTPGAGGDVIHVFRYDASGHASFDHLIAVPAPSGASPPQNFPPTNMARVAWPDRLAIAPDGARLLVPLNLADQAAVIDVSTRAVSYVATGSYPYGAAVSRDGRLGFVSNESPGTVSVIDMASAKKLRDIAVGGHLSHPEALLADPRADRVYVTVTNSDQVAVIDTRTQVLTNVVSVGRPEGLGTAPNALAESADGRRLLVSEGGADELAVLKLPGSGPAPDYTLLGRVPTAQYPTDVQATPTCPGRAGPTARKRPAKKRRAKRHRARHRRARGRRHPRHRRSHRRRRHPHRPARPRRPASPPSACSKLVYLSGKGLGTGPNPNGPQPNSPLDTDEKINATQYLPLLNVGVAGIGAFPSDVALVAQGSAADRQVRPSNPQAPPADTPLRAGGPIKHVFYIVRENRTYDQILGDDPRGDGDPKLALFGGKASPNAHSLVQRFPLIDHFYANSEASIDGHFWTSAGSVSDYVNKNWFQNYAGRPRPYDFGVFSVTWPANGFLFDQADRQGISYFNYGEAIAGTVPLTDKDRTNEENAQVAAKFAKSDLGSGAASLPTNTPAGGGAVALTTQPSTCYPNDASIGQDAITKQPVFDSPPPLGASPQSESRFDCFNQHFQTQVATGTVPTFNYLVLSNDHTQVLSPGARTPTAMIADNDYGLGKIVEAISHSSIWSSSAVFVTEDDSQDGADHVDAHRTVGMVFSPFTRPGAVVHTRYDMLSLIRSMELIMGMRPLYLGDALATPMYDVFQGLPANSAAYEPVAPQTDLLATNPPAASAAAARRLRFRGLDQITQAQEDRLLWRSVHGPRSTPPPPGPNAVIEPAAGRAHPDR